MLKYITITLLLGITFLGAENLQEVSMVQTRQSSLDLQQLANQKEALALKLESIKLQKKIIEIQNFIEKDKLEKQERAERKAALLKLKSDLRRKRYNQSFLSAYRR